MVSQWRIFVVKLIGGSLSMSWREDARRVDSELCEIVRFGNVESPVENQIVIVMRK